MGWNSVAVILHDHLHDIEKDAAFGERIGRAVRGFSMRKHRIGADEADARTENCVSIGSLKVISQDHASGRQVVVVHGNTGVALWDDDCPQWAVDACAAALERKGYKVTKRKPKPSASRDPQQHGED